MGPLSPQTAGAPTEDLQALSRQKVNMDTATFKMLQTEAVLVRLGAGPRRGCQSAGVRSEVPRG